MKSVGPKLLITVPIILSGIVSYELGRQNITQHLVAYLIVVAIALLAWLGVMQLISIVE